MLIWALLFCLAVIAFGLSAVSGGGAGLLLMPLLGMIVPAAQVPAALSIGTASSAISRIAAFHASVRWEIVRYFVPAALPFCVLGAWLLTWMDPLYLEICLALFLIGNLPLLFLPRKPASAPIWAGGRLPLMAIGAGAGFLSGFTGAVGLVFNRFYFRLGLRKEEIVATRAANEILLHLLKLCLYGMFGLLSVRVLLVGLVVAAAAISSSFLMRVVLPLLHEHVFHHVSHTAMGLAGIAMLVTSGSTLAGREHITISCATAPSGQEASMGWGRHVLSVELEDGREIEIKHTIRSLVFSSPSPLEKNNRKIQKILHLSPASGIYVTRRIL